LAAQGLPAGDEWLGYCAGRQDAGEGGVQPVHILSDQWQRRRRRQLGEDQVEGRRHHGSSDHGALLLHDRQIRLLVKARRLPSAGAADAEDQVVFRLARQQEAFRPAIEIFDAPKAPQLHPTHPFSLRCPSSVQRCFLATSESSHANSVWRRLAMAALWPHNEDL